MSEAIKRTGKVFAMCAIILSALFLVPNKAFAAGTISASFDKKTGTLTYSTSSDLYYGFMVSYPGGNQFIPYGGGIPGETTMSYSFSDYFKENGTYSFQVFAVNQGESFIVYGDTIFNAVAQSERISFYWSKPSAKLSTPTNFQWEQSGSQIVFSWNKVSNSKRYEIIFYEDTSEKRKLITSNPYWHFALNEFSKGHSYSATVKAISADISAYCDSDVSAKADSLKLNQNGNPTVNGKPIPGSPEYQQEEYPSDIKLNRSKATLYYGQELTLEATITPSDAKNKTITWTSSKPSVATVSGGVVKAKTAGSTTITAKTANGLTAKCEVTVYADNNPSNEFADIKYGTWQYNAAKAVYDKGYMTGKGTLGSRVLFSPDTDINRSQFVVSLYSMDGKPSVTYKQKFSDVSSTDWYATAVTWASERGIVAGNPDGSFGVNGRATREQLALMFYKYAKYKNYDVSVSSSTTLDGFTDAGKVDSWALTAIKWAVERGIISGKGNEKDGYRIDPTKGATRIECAAMMNKFDAVYSKALMVVLEDEEEPLALPMEEIEDVPIPADETEDEAEDEEEAEDEDEAEAETEAKHWSLSGV